MNPQRATATEIWQRHDKEYEGLCGFLWSDVTEMKCARHRCFDEEAPIEWVNKSPKTIIVLADTSCLIVLGKVEKWFARWDNYLGRSEQYSMLFTKN